MIGLLYLAAVAPAVDVSKVEPHRSVYPMYLQSSDYLQEDLTVKVVCNVRTIYDGNFELVADFKDRAVYTAETQRVLRDKKSRTVSLVAEGSDNFRTSGVTRWSERYSDGDHYEFSFRRVEKMLLFKFSGISPDITGSLSIEMQDLESFENGKIAKVYGVGLCETANQRVRPEVAN